MTWMNSDGLFVKFGKEEGVAGRGGAIGITDDGAHTFSFIVNYTDFIATTQILGAGASAEAGSLGVQIPKGLFVEAIELVAETPFTSSGTIATATMVMGLIRSDRTTEHDYDGFTTTAAIGSIIDAAGEKTVLTKGSTGAGALVGTTLANNGYITVSNSQHASHPFTAGKLVVRIKGYYP